MTENLSQSDMTGPFGLSIGLKKDEINGKLTEIKPFVFQTEHVPKKHSSFENYVLKIGPKSGLSWIKAIGKSIQTNDFGISVKASFEEMKDKLAKKYGQPEEYDFLLTGSIWNEPNDWMNGIINGERSLVASWKSSSTQTLPNNLESIFLGAQAEDTSSGYLIIEYSFTNHKASEEEIAEIEDDAL